MQVSWFILQIAWFPKRKQDRVVFKSESLCWEFYFCWGGDKAKRVSKTLQAKMVLSLLCGTQAWHWLPARTHVKQVETNGLHGDSLWTHLGPRSVVNMRLESSPGFLFAQTDANRHPMRCLLWDSVPVPARSNLSLTTMRYLSRGCLKETISRENCS